MNTARALGALSVALIACRGSAPAGSVAHPPCRHDPLANVHHADRLRLLNECVSVTGVVRRVVFNPHDGDANFDLQVDPRFSGLIAPGNDRRLGGLLHVEIVPADQAGCSPGRPLPPVNGLDMGTCTGADVSPPEIGARVVVTGAYVDDHTNAWHEVHPAWAVEYVPLPRR